MKKTDKTRKMMLGCKWNNNGYWVAYPDLPFTPMGLMIWNAPPGTMIRQFLIGNQTQVLASWDAVPTAFFSMAKSYTQLKTMIDEGYEPPNWCDFDGLQLGNNARMLLIDSKGRPLTEEGDIQMAMWGTVPTYDFI